MNNLKGACLFLIIISLFFVFSATGCVEIFQKVTVNRDGSGTGFLEIHISKEVFPMVARELKRGFPKGWSMVGEKDVGNKHVISMKANFKILSDLSDHDMRYTFSSKKLNFFKDSYAVLIEPLKIGGDPVPFELTIEIPGSTINTNGVKISSNQVKWTFNGFSKGMAMFVESSAFAIRFYVGLTLISILLIAGTFVITILTRKSLPDRTSPISKKIFCTQCGKENDSRAVFCVYCGQRIE